MISAPPWSIYWEFPVLLVIVSLVYSATRFDRRDLIVREAFRWGWKMASFLGCIGIGLFLISYFLID